MNNIDTKLCRRCKEEKQITEFYTQKRQDEAKGEWLYYNPECKQCTKERSYKWRAENKEAFTKSIKKYTDQPHVKEVRRRVSKEVREQGKYKEWQQKNKSKLVNYNKNRRLNKTHKISEKEWESCKIFFNSSCAYCGLSEAQAKIKYNNNLHKEHVVHEGENTIDNCVPACKGCNSKKFTFSLEEWYTPTNKVYTEKRMSKIMEWLKSYEQIIQ